MTRVSPVFRTPILRVSVLALALASVPVYADTFADRGRQQAMIHLLVRAGKSEEAAAAMRALYPSGPPIGGELALEYYDVIGNTDKGWEEAKAALEKLVKAAPEDVDYRLALARQLARRPATRRAGLQMFVDMSGQPDVKQRVLEEWRRALSGLDSSSASIKLYQDYLKADPGNAPILDALANAQRAEASRLPWQMRDKADAQLAAGHPDEAVAILKKALKLDPKNAWVRFDLSRLYHKQGNEKQGHALMEEGMSVAPGDADILYANALYASLLDETENALRLLGKIPAYKRSPAMQRLGRELTIQARTPKVNSGAQAAAKSSSQSGAMRDKADAQLAAGHLEEALATLKEGLRLEPKSAWVRFDLSRLHHKQGDEEQGRALMDEGLSVAPGDDDMLYADALYVSLLGETENALSLLEKIPASRRSPAMQRLNHKLTIQEQTRQALALARSGKRAEMQAVMQHAETDAGNDAELVNVVANAWFDLNDPVHGVALMQRLATQPSPPKDTSLYYAKLLNRAERDEELSAVMEKLSAAGDLTASDKEDLRYLKASMAVRQADTLRHAGSFSAATAVLAPALRDDPENTDLLMAQARVHMSAHEPQQAKVIYQWMLDRPQREMEARLAQEGRPALAFDMGVFEPVNVSVRLALAKALREAGDKTAAQREMKIVLANTSAEASDNLMAIADGFVGMGNIADARAIVEQSRKSSPDNPGVLIQAGRVALADKSYDEAMADFRQAKVAENKKKGAMQTASAPLPMLAEQAIQTEADREIASMERRRKGRVETGYTVLTKPGAPGVSNFTMTELPVEAHVPLGYSGHVFVRSNSVSVDTGLLPLDPVKDAYTLTHYGTITALSLATPSEFAKVVANARQSAKGTDLEVGYETDDWSAYVGSTPQGFPVQDIVGGFNMYRSAEPFFYSVDVARRAVTSSLVSYAGVRDPISGEVWGGVRSTGVDFRVGIDRGRLGASVNFGYQLLTGKNVPNNIRFEFRPEIDWAFIQKEDMNLSVGLAFTYWHYRDDQSNYTFGQGGYYSPQDYNSLSMPVRWSGNTGRWSYLLKGAVSTSATHVKDMPYYPTNPALQTATGSVFQGSNSKGQGFSFGSELEYHLTPHSFVGGRIDIDRSDYYTPDTATAYLRYMFDPVPFPSASIKSSQQEGVYLLGAAGQMRIGNYQAAGDVYLRSIGATGISSAINNATVYKLQLGYQANANLAVEGGYADLGKLSYSATGAGFPGAASAASSQLKVNAWNIDAVGILPLGSSLGLLGKAGIAIVRSSEVNMDFYNSALGAITNRMSIGNKTKTGLTYGVGIKYDIGPNFSLRADLDRYDTGITELDRITVRTLGAAYKF